jgi:Lon protease-like protein
MYSLPLFPLDTVLFPGMPIHLYIFEERYKIMIQRVLEKDGMFGVVLIHNGSEAFGPPPEPHNVGCTAKIVEVDSLSDGRMNLVCIGRELFRIRELDHRLPYLVGQVETFITEQPRTLDIVRGAGILRKLVSVYIKLLGSIHREDEPDVLDLQPFLNQLDLPEDPTMLLYMACALLQVPTNEKQNLLEIASIPNLFGTVMRWYKREISINAKLTQITDESSRRSAWLN